MNIIKNDNAEVIRVAFVIDFLMGSDGLIGGTERQLIETIQRIDNKKFIILLVCLKEYGKVDVLNSLQCEKMTLNITSILSFTGLSKILHFAGILKKMEIDIVQTFFFDSTLVGTIAAKMAGVKHVIGTRRDMGFSMNNILLLTLRVLNVFTNRFLVNSSAVKDVLVKREKVRKDKIDIIYNGIDMEKFHNKAAKNLHEIKNVAGDRIVGIVGNYNRRVKRMDVFIRAAHEVLKIEKSVKFLIVGGGKLESELRSLASDLDIVESVKLTGVVHEIAPYLESFTIGVLTSDSEGFSNALMEYMAAGIPSIATNVGGNKEVIEDQINGFLFPPGDHMSLSRIILKLLHDSELCQKIGERAKQTIMNNYSWNVKIKEIEDYYHNTTKNTRPTNKITKTLTK